MTAPARHPGSGPRLAGTLRAAAKLGAAFFLLAAGCAPGPAAIAEANGEITLDGMPVEAGIVSFISDSAGGPSGGAAISEGRYRLYPDSGLPPGRYRVEIRWAKPTGEKVKEPVYGHPPDIFAEAIPAKYNSESVLNASLSKGTNEVNFRLEK